MPRSQRRFARPARAPAKRLGWRLAFLAALTSWNRYQVGRVIGGLFLTWLIGAVGLYLIEGASNPGYSSLGESLWNVWALLFSGLDDASTPKTGIGRLLVMILVVAGVGLA